MHDIDGATVSLHNLIKKIMQNALQPPGIELGPVGWEANMLPLTYQGLMLRRANILSIQGSYV